jgi:hypothetical protein
LRRPATPSTPETRINRVSSILQSSISVCSGPTAAGSAPIPRTKIRRRLSLEPVVLREALGRQASGFGAIAKRDNIEFRSVVEAVRCSSRCRPASSSATRARPRAHMPGVTAAHDDVFPPPVGAAAKRRRGSNSRREGSRLWAT